MKIIKLNKHGTLALTIPKQVAVGYCWKEGDEFGHKIDEPRTITYFKK